MTTERRRNLDLAINLAKQAVGWAGPTADIPFALRDRYTDALAAVIVKHPARFDAQTLANARRELGDAPIPSQLENLGIAEGARIFAAEVANQAGEIGESVAAVGEGVKTTLGLTRWVLPLAALVAVVLLLRGFARRTA